MYQLASINKQSYSCNTIASGTRADMGAKMSQLQADPAARKDNFFAMYDQRGNLISSTFSAGLPACGVTSYRKDYAANLGTFKGMPTRKKKA